MKILLIIMTLIPSISFAKYRYSNEKCKTTTKNPIYCTILRLNPKIEKKFAWKMSNLIYKYSKNFKLDPYRTIAIIQQESGFRNISNRTLIAYKDKDKFKYKQGFIDIGLYQFNIYTIKRKHLNIHRLLNDLDYATYHHFKLLKEKIRSCKNLAEDSWTCYHSKTPILRKFYKKMVNRYYFNPTKKTNKRRHK